MIDTGSDINLIRYSSLREPNELDQHQTIQILGITGNKSSTLGSCILRFRDQPHEFHVTDLDLPDECDGILGSGFLAAEEAEVSFYHKTLVTKSHPIKPIHFMPTGIQNLDAKTYLVKARSRKPVRVPVANLDLEEGLLNKVTLPDGLFLGNAAVRNDGGTCLAFVINTTNEDHQIYIPPQTLEVFDENPELDDFRDYPFPNAPPLGIRDRVQEVKQLLRLMELNTEERESVLELISEYSDIFHLPDEQLPATNVCKHKIPTTDEIPINTRQYRFPPVHREEIQTQVNKMLEADIVRPSSSPYNSPLLVVAKKSDSKGNKRLRLVIDFRRLNEKTIADAYPLPHISEILERLGGAKYFSIFNLASGFHQILMDEADAPKTAFSTPNGHFEYVRMPFGLRNAPAQFQRAMETALSGMSGTKALVYIDDIVVYASSLQEHSSKIRKLFGLLREANLRLQQVRIPEEGSVLPGTHNI